MDLNRLKALHNGPSGTRKGLDVFARRRSEGLSLNSGSPSLAVGCYGADIGQNFGEGFGWMHDVSDSCEIARKHVEAKRLEVCGFLFYFHAVHTGLGSSIHEESKKDHWFEPEIGSQECLIIFSNFLAS